MNPDLNRLQPYPFEKLASLKEATTPPTRLQHIALSIGEPQQPTPHFISEALISHLHRLSNYPTTKGLPELRETICGWLTQRFELGKESLDPERNVLPVNGTREALFSFAQAVIDRSDSPIVAMPNPFYQIYEGAALLAGAEPRFIPCDRQNHYLPDFNHLSESDWDRCQLLYICSPGNPTGAVLTLEQLKQLIELSEKHNFVIASDECYSEIYCDEQSPPPGLLQAAFEMGNSAFKRCVVFHSLSKRSNAPGLRSGFVAGDSDILERFFKYRTYHGCAMSLPVQHASIAGWKDEKHVVANRSGYRDRFDTVLEILDGKLDVDRPDAGFYLWARTPIDDTIFAQRLFAEQNITVLPGSYLSRNNNNTNPGCNHVRMALVAPANECAEAATRISNFLEQFQS